MDHFGIEAAMRGMLLTYQRCARQSGRTTSLVESVKDGDRIVFAERREAERVERLLKERGVKVACIVIDPNDARRLMERGSLSSDGRTIFDHTWVESFYAQAIDRAASDIDFLQRETSGYGEAHRETARRAKEIARWRA
jgi:hypothetical protein